MHNFTVFVDEMSTQPLAYMIAVSPSSRSCGGMATKHYSTREGLAQDLQQKLRYTGEAINWFFASDDRHHTLMHHPLNDDDAAYFGWIPEYGY